MLDRIRSRSLYGDDQRIRSQGSRGTVDTVVNTGHGRTTNFAGSVSKAVNYRGYNSKNRSL